MDLEVEVTERSTGQFTAGIGFSSIENVVFTASVSQSNLFGRGQSISLSARVGSLSQDFTIDFQEPYLFGRPITGGVSVFRRSLDYDTFESRRTGVGLTIGRTLGEYARASVTYNYEIVEIDDLDPGASELLQQEEGTSYTSSLTPRIVWDSRDNQFDPAGGSVQAFEVTGAGLGGTNRYYKVVGSTTWYFPLPEGLTGFVRGRFGIGDGYAGKELPAGRAFFSRRRNDHTRLRISRHRPERFARQPSGGHFVPAVQPGDWAQFRSPLTSGNLFRCRECLQSGQSIRLWRCTSECRRWLPTYYSSGTDSLRLWVQTR